MEKKEEVDGKNVETSADLREKKRESHINVSSRATFQLSGEVEAL